MKQWKDVHTGEYFSQMETQQDAMRVLTIGAAQSLFEIYNTQLGYPLLNSLLASLGSEKPDDLQERISNWDDHNE